MSVSRSKRVLLLILAAFILAGSVAAGPLAGFSVAQDGTQPPEWFNDCQKDKFSKLTPDEQQEIAEQPTERGQRDALRGITTQKDIECGDNNENKDPPSDIAEEEDPEKQQERKEDEQKDNQDKQDRNDEADENYNDQSGPGGIAGMGVTVFQGMLDWAALKIEEASKEQAKNMAEEITEGKYRTAPPSNGLVGIYEDTADWVKPGAIALLLLLAVSMTLRGTNYNTAYAAQHGIPKIITVLAGIAFFPDIINMLADLAQAMSKAIIDEGALQQGLETVYTRNAQNPVLAAVIWIAKGILSVLIVFAIGVKNLLFGALFVLGPLAMLFHAIPKFSDVATAWLRGMLACFAVSVLWAIEFGIGFRFVADPGLIFTPGSQDNSEFVSVLLSLGIVWLVWKTPWKVFEWAFYSYGGSSGVGSKMALVSLLKLLKK